MRYDKDKIKESLTIEQIFDLVADMGGEPVMYDGFFISNTICHNPIGEGSKKLYYYENTRLFHCYTGCADPSFDIFQLVQKVKNINENKVWELFTAVAYVADYFGIASNKFIDFNDGEKLEDWEILERYNRANALLEQKNVIDFKVYDDKILKFLPQPHIETWEEDDGITYDVIQHFGIKYDPITSSIIIPHRDLYGNLIGIRQRTLVKELEQFGKYRPATFSGKMYNHPLGFSLYGLDKNAAAISAIKKAIVAEGEKSVLQYASWFGVENNIVVASCGSNLIQHQVDLLLSLGVEEIIIAFDRQFQEPGDVEWEKWTKKLSSFHEKYSRYVTISFVFDQHNDLGYKESPFDRGKEIFCKMFKERIYL